MKEPCLHLFSQTLPIEERPQTFTNPFHYTPHLWTRLAMQEVSAYLPTITEWQEALAEGKMFGVLVVETPQKEIGYLAAFSGNINGENKHPFFVPPICDLLNPQGYFKQEEQRISAINKQIKNWESSRQYIKAIQKLSAYKEKQTQIRKQAEEAYKTAKKQRDEKRQGTISTEERLLLEKESQYMKASLRRLQKKQEKDLLKKNLTVQIFHLRIERLKRERKKRSATLQERLFSDYKLLNAEGEIKDIQTIFSENHQGIPPAGTGECALPKLLQYAYAHSLQPLCMGEFWWGNSSKESIRHHGKFYPSCTAKCKPILSHMLKGLSVEHTEKKNWELAIVYEDDFLLAVDKPAGLLSVPGKEDSTSVLSLLETKQPDQSYYMIHRLDMDTSGLLLIAKDLQTYKAMQYAFSHRLVKKEYHAILEGVVTAKDGTIHLPLSPHYEERPRQKVDETYGKEAITKFQVEKVENGYTWIRFYPQTGRTHQLRLHAAHEKGLNCPIYGDALYGKSKANRMYLHAYSVSFFHPMKEEEVFISCASHFCI